SALVAASRYLTCSISAGVNFSHIYTAPAQREQQEFRGKNQVRSGNLFRILKHVRTIAESGPSTTGTRTHQCALVWARHILGLVRGTRKNVVPREAAQAYRDHLVPMPAWVKKCRCASTRVQTLRCRPAIRPRKETLSSGHQPPKR